MAELNLLDTMGISTELYEETKTEASTGNSFLWESGAIKVEITEAAVFGTESGAKMLKVSFKDADDREFTDYQNTSYIAKEDKDKVKKGDRCENPGGAKIFKALLSAANVEPASATMSEGKIKAYGKDDVDAIVIDSLKGRSVVALVRQVEDPNSEQYPDSNQIEGYADVEGNINGSSENLDKWKLKIEKQPVLVKKAKKGSTAKATTATSDAAKSAAKSLLD